MIDRVLFVNLGNHQLKQILAQDKLEKLYFMKISHQRKLEVLREALSDQLEKDKT